ncbi:MAG: hypothetical protein ACAH80_08335 [Alphaproteobacteria bacterium]
MTKPNTTILHPILWDAMGEPVRVDASSVEAALKGVKIEADMLGFEFAAAGRRGSTYMFAEAVYTRAEYAAIAANDPDNRLSRQFNSIPQWKFNDPATVVYTSAQGVRAFEACDHPRVTLVDKTGKQLFPRPKA